ncbi:MAG: peptide ABC transporter substrate-binding protein [Anaerolineae bacterium]
MSNKKTLLIVIIALGLLCACILACGAGALLWARNQSAVVATPEAATERPPVEDATPASSFAPGIKDSEAEARPPETSSETADGGVLRLAGELPPTLDPAMVQDSSSALYAVHLFSGLVSLSADLEIVPDLATAWDLENDGRTYVFHLDPDAVFADGTPISAQDVVYSWERACGPELGSPVAAAYLDDVVGVDDYALGRAETISGLEVRATHTLAVTIDAPKAYFLAKLTYPAALLVDRTRVEEMGERWVLDPNGSGPFVLETLTEDLIVLERNVRYNGTLAKIDRVEFILGGGLPITMYENDQLDIVSVWPDELDRVMDPYNPLSAELYIAPELSTEYLAMNVSMPPFDDPAVRQAILKAIDRDKLAELVLNNSAVAGRGVLPPGLIPVDPDPAAAVMSYDPEEARRLLATSQYAADGAMPPIVLSISGTSGYMPGMTEAVLAMIEENLGLQVTVEQIEWSSFLDDLNQRRYAFYSSGWIADYPDPQNFVDLLFHSRSAQNHTAYASAEVDALLEQARIEQDHDRRMELYLQAEVLILQDAPWVPLTHGVSYTLVKPWVKGYQASASLYPWLKDVYLVD